MFKQVQGSWSVLCIVAIVALRALPAAAQSASTTVPISVPAVQQAEGTTSLVVSSGAPLQQGALAVKSNISWMLVAHSSNPNLVVAWRVAGASTWQQIGAATPVLTGLKGVRQVEYEVQLESPTKFGLQTTVTLSVEQADAH